jgi:molecular chaperone HscB
MEYFELFQLEPLLNMDLATLEKKFHDLSREYHPDFHTSASPEEQARALETTALLNDAYRTLRDSTRRAEYLVKSQGFKIDGSKVPQAILMEVFEINEGLDELRAARESGDAVDSLIEAVNEFRKQIAEKRQAYEEELQQASTRWDELVANKASEQDRRGHLQKLADIISLSSYIRNLEHEMDDEVSH